MKPVSHQLDVYGTWLHVATDRRGYAAIRRKLPSIDRDPGGQGACSLTLHTTPAGKTIPHVVVWLDVTACENVRDLVDLVAHESAHAAGALLDHVGQTYDGDSEALAYLVGWIAGWLWEVCGTAS